MDDSVDFGSAEILANNTVRVLVTYKGRPVSKFDRSLASFMSAPEELLAGETKWSRVVDPVSGKPVLRARRLGNAALAGLIALAQADGVNETAVVDLADIEVSGLVNVLPVSGDPRRERDAYVGSVIVDTPRD